MGKIPNRTLIHDTFSGKDFENLIGNKKIEDKIVFSEIIPIENDYSVNEKILIRINLNLWFSYTKINSTSENFLISDVCIYFKEYNTEVYKTIEEIKNCSINFGSKNEEYDKINTLSISNGIFELDPILPIDYSDVMDYHPNIDIKSIKKISKSIKSKNKTFSIIYGPIGCGKTHTLKWILSTLDRISIFIPNNMIDQTINNPEFKNFLKRFDECIIILDDSEFNYGYKSPYLSGNIIQLLEFVPNIHIIMIFNVDNECKIDEDILRSNNLENIIQFNLLESKFATNLSEKIGFNKKYLNKVLISDVIKNKKNRQKNKIGII